MESNTVSNTLNVQATLKPTQWQPATGEDNKSSATYKWVVYDQPNIVMKTEEQYTAIRVAFYNEYTMPK